MKLVKRDEPKKRGARDGMRGPAGEEWDNSLCSQCKYLEVQCTSCLKCQMFAVRKFISS